MVENVFDLKIFICNFGAPEEKLIEISQTILELRKDLQATHQPVQGSKGELRSNEVHISFSFTSNQ